MEQNIHIYLCKYIKIHITVLMYKYIYIDIFKTLFDVYDFLFSIAMCIYVNINHKKYFFAVKKANKNIKVSLVS